MRKLSEQEILDVDGGKKWFSIVGGALFGGGIEGIMGLAVGGPAGFIVGFGHGL